MRPSSSRVEAILLSSLLFPALAAALGNIDCGRIQTEGVRFDLSKLGGPHVVVGSNTTYTIDICKNLERPKSIKDDTKFCPGGTRVCGIEQTGKEGEDDAFKVIPIAGDLRDRKGGDLDAQFERIKSSASHSDTDKEGVRIIMNGGLYDGKKQRAIVEFICNKDRTGDEGNPAAEDGKKSKKSSERREEEKKSEDDKKDGDEKSSPSLTFKSYGPDPDKKMDILRLQWETKYACEEQEESEANGWGFFTWFILIAFLGTAAYLVFGSWLNYNRYGARGWDLLPHGDTIRDVPYLFKDWTRRVVNTVQGSGSRGGYSAV